jgi:LysR family transcriptional regulator (chromosome initiation inhibitor)
MELDHLRTLLAAVDSGSFEGASRALRITPSAVSQRIKALETQTGRVLLQRSKPVEATESGTVVLRLARQLDLLEREASALLDVGATGLVGVSLVVNADSLGTWVLAALAGVDGVAFDIRREDQDHSTSLLRAGAVMGAVTSDPEPVQGCTVTRLGAMRYSAMASPGFLAKWLPGGPTAAALAVAPVVDFDRRDALQDRYLQPRVAASVSPPRHYVPASSDFVAAVALGLGWAMVPELQAEAHLAAGRLVEIDPAHPLDVPLYWQQWALDSPALARVAAALTAAAGAALRP